MQHLSHSHFSPRDKGSEVPSESLNFLHLRHTAALFVLIAHSFALSGKMPTDVLAAFPALEGIAPLGVTIFFIISGYLVTKSWTQEPSWIVFARKRFLRIYPAFVTCLIFCICVGSVFTNLKQDAYWQSSEVMHYFIKNMLLQNYPPLPGVFEGNPFKSVVNGSLWTIPIEVSCYIGVLMLGISGLLKSKRRSMVCLVAALLWVVFWGQNINIFGATVQSAALPTYYAAFIFGAIFFQLKEWLSPSMLLAGCLLVVAWFIPSNNFTHFLGIAALGYFVVNLAQWMGHRWSEKRGSIDLSYGIYLYAFPIQQSLSDSFPQDTGWMLLAKTIPLCLICALFSWFVVERPALKLK